MTQVVNEPTRVTRESQTLIDIICSSQPQNITSVKVAKSALSDHDMTAFVRKLNSLKFKPRTIKCRNYSKYCATSFNEDLSFVSWDNLSECQDRPISVLQVASKIFERAVQIQLHLDKSSQLSPFQCGFRKNNSTQDAVTYILRIVLGKALTKVVLQQRCLLTFKKRSTV